MKEQIYRKNYGTDILELTADDIEKMRAIKEILYRGKDAHVKLGKYGEIKVYSSSMELKA